MHEDMINAPDIVAFRSTILDSLALQKADFGDDTRFGRSEQFFTDPRKDPSSFEKTIRAGRPQHALIAWSHSHDVRTGRTMIQPQGTNAAGFGTETIDAGHGTKRTQLCRASFLVDRLELRIRLP